MFVEPEILSRGNGAMSSVLSLDFLYELLLILKGILDDLPL